MDPRHRLEELFSNHSAPLVKIEEWCVVTSKAARNPLLHTDHFCRRSMLRQSLLSRAIRTPLHYGCRLYLRNISLLPCNTTRYCKGGGSSGSNRRGGSSRRRSRDRSNGRRRGGRSNRRW